MAKFSLCKFGVGPPSKRCVEIDDVNDVLFKIDDLGAFTVTDLGTVSEELLTRMTNEVIENETNFHRVSYNDLVEFGLVCPTDWISRDTECLLVSVMTYEGKFRLLWLHQYFE